MQRPGDHGPSLDPRRWTEVLLQHAFDAVIVLGPDALVTYASPGTERVLGYRPEEIIGQPAPTYWPDSDASELEPVLRDLLAEPGRTVVLTSRAVHKDGRIRVLESYAHNLLDDPEVRGVVINARDVTDRVEAEEERSRTDAQLRQMVALTSEGIWILDDDRRITFANPRAAALFAMGKLEGRNVLEIMGPTGRVALLEHLDRVLAGDHRRDELEIVRLDGTELWVWIASSRLPDDAGTRRVMSIITDVSEVHEAREQRRALQHQMVQAQRLESLGALAGGIAHSFNNLLAVILGNAGLALSQLPPGAPVRDELNDIETAARRAAELTRQMLVYSGRSAIIADTVDMSSLVAEIRELLEVAVARNAKIGYDLDDGLPEVAASADQLHQIVMNLAINASEALDGTGGSITIRTRELAAGKHLFEGAVTAPDGPPSASYVCLDVVDDGMGMTDTTRARMFDPFFSTKFTGRGLGLASVLGIVRGLKGAIRVTTEPGRGTTFCVLLPATSAPRRSEREPATTPNSSTTPRRDAIVLAVDDDAAVRLLVERVLQAEGMTVLTASSGTDAIAIFEQQSRVDLVLIDLTMDGLRGDEALLAMRRTDPHVRAVLMSGYSERYVESDLVGDCVAAFVQKPFDIDELRAVVHDALAER
ncbi:MAG: PAS domain S-box protein [Actinobacteria bacterium]|nr:PAS domain S-box protein [Actinomycetota bacterium]